MSDGFQFFDIILFALVAAFLVLRLRSVLGRRTGFEKPRDPDWARRSATPPANGNNNGNVVSLPEPARAAPQQQGDGLKQIRAADPRFDPDGFITGARTAFEMIVHAFAGGETATLRPLLSDEVFDRFAEAIRARTQAKETLETNLVAIKEAGIAEAEMNGRTAFVTVKFVSEQVNVTRGADGKAVEGDPERVVEKTDFWTFARNTLSQDPNWLLVATHSG
jgi:predicted lipid-binding transport protein (Tim44 family)